VDSSFEEIEIEAGNTNCLSSSDSLIALNRTTLMGHFGLTENVIVCRDYDTLSSFSFTGCQRMLTVSFECGSKISRVENGISSQCHALKSICIPAGVEIFGESCFSDCSSLSQVTFESSSKLTEMGWQAFSKC
jgi:hypothetical protein